MLCMHMWPLPRVSRGVIEHGANTSSCWFSDSFQAIPELLKAEPFPKRLAGLSLRGNVRRARVAWPASKASASRVGDGAEVERAHVCVCVCACVLQKPTVWGVYSGTMCVLSAERQLLVLAHSLSSGSQNRTPRCFHFGKYVVEVCPAQVLLQATNTLVGPFDMGCGASAMSISHEPQSCAAATLVLRNVNQPPGLPMLPGLKLKEHSIDYDEDSLAQSESAF